MSVRTDVVTDEYDNPVEGATVYVKNADGSYATLTSDGTTPLAQPVLTDQFGFYTYYAVDAVYTEEIWYAGKLRAKNSVIVGDPLAFKGDPGGNTMAIGLFVGASALLIPIGTDLVQTSGYNAKGKGAGLYAEDTTLNDAYVAANPRTSFKSANGRYFKLVSQYWTPFHFGAVGDGATDDLPALQALSDFFFNDGTVFYDYTLDLSGYFAISGQLNLGPTGSPSTRIRGRAVLGQFTVKQLQAGVTRSVKVRNLNYGVYPIRFELLGYGSPTGYSTFANRDTFIGIEFENCAYAQFMSVFAHGFYYAGVNVIGNSPLFAEHLRIGNVIGQFIGSGYTGANASLTSSWTAGAQSGTAGSVVQSQIINVATLPKTLLDTAGPLGVFPGAVRVRINGYPYLVTAIDRGTNNVTIYPWLDSAAGSSGTLTWCFGGSFVIQGSDTEGCKVDKLYSIFTGAGFVAAAAYGPTMGEIDVESCGTGVVFGSNPNNVSYGHQIGNLYCEGNAEDVIPITHWGSFQYWQIASSYTITTSKIFQIGDPRNADSSFGYAAGGFGLLGGGMASIEIAGTPHRYYGPPPGGSNVPTTTAVFVDHGDRPTVRPQFRDSQTVTISTVDTNLSRLFGYPGAVWVYIGTGTNGAPTGTFTFNPPSGGTINGGAVNAGVSFSGFSGPVSFGIYHTDAACLTWQVRVLSGRMTSGSAAIGYATGSGGSVTQATGKGTAVTLNKPTGQITMNNGSLAAGTTNSFQLTNSFIAATDTVVVSIASGASPNSYIASVDSVSAGSCQIALRNVSAGALSENVVLNFAVIKGASS